MFISWQYARASMLNCTCPLVIALSLDTSAVPTRGQLVNGMGKWSNVGVRPLTGKGRTSLPWSMFHMELGSCGACVPL